MPAQRQDSAEPPPDARSEDLPPRLILDACCYVNLFASGRIQEVVTELPFRFAVVEAARREVTFVRRGGDGDDAQDSVPVDWDEVLQPTLVETISFASEAEETDFIALLDILDEGEAATLAVAINRGIAVATDERKARATCAARAPHLPVLSTLDLLKQWTGIQALSSVEIGQLLRNVRERGRFLPPRGDPLASWWYEHLPQRR